MRHAARRLEFGISRGMRRPPLEPESGRAHQAGRRRPAARDSGRARRNCRPRGWADRRRCGGSAAPAPAARSGRRGRCLVGQHPDILGDPARRQTAGQPCAAAPPCAPGRPAWRASAAPSETRKSRSTTGCGTRPLRRCDEGATEGAIAGGGGIVAARCARAGPEQGAHASAAMRGRRKGGAVPRGPGGSASTRVLRKTRSSDAGSPSQSVCDARRAAAPRPAAAGRALGRKAASAGASASAAAGMVDDAHGAGADRVHQPGHAAQAVRRQLQRVDASALAAGAAARRSGCRPVQRFEEHGAAAHGEVAAFDQRAGELARQEHVLEPERAAGPGVSSAMLARHRRRPAARRAVSASCQRSKKGRSGAPASPRNISGSTRPSMRRFSRA